MILKKPINHTCHNLLLIFKMPDNEVGNLHKAFDLVFKSLASTNSEEVQLSAINTKKHKLNQINIDLHVSSQMILLYPDIDSENLIKEIVSTFNKMAFKHSK